MNRVRRLKLLLWMVAGLAAAVASARFFFGLGVTTNLSDASPWGVWIGFDVMSGVALAAGGFVVTATVYIFKLERFHGIVRPAVLTAFLGYVAVAVSLLFDLGLPWNIWHMIVFWNPHSPLFEVGWCVMLYLTVLALEFFPVVGEEFSALSRIRQALIKLRLPLIIGGIGLSTLHQSSLGSLFLIMPYRLHPLWYSPILPVLFFISAIALGLAMVSFESHFSAYIYRRKPETALLAEFGAAARWVLALYLAVRFGDLAVRGQLAQTARGGWAAGMFWFEIAAMAAVPAVLLSIGQVRRSRAGQWLVAGLSVFGVVLNRIDAGGFMHSARGNAFYVPAWTEVAVSAGIVAAAALVYLFVMERFRVWEQRPADPDAAALKLPEFNPVGATWLGVPAVAARTVYSLAFIIAAAAGFALLPAPAESRGVEPAPVRRARGGDTFWIDGNLDGYGVAFTHEKHGSREGGKVSCVRCHHMNLPRDRNSACSQCHRDMYAAADAFRHDWHASPEGARIACNECHEANRVRNAASAVRCERCHKDLIPAGSAIAVKKYRAVSYTVALHRACIGCHALKAKEVGKPEMARCVWCHQQARGPVDTWDRRYRDEGLVGKGILVPTVGSK